VAENATATRRAVSAALAEALSGAVDGSGRLMLLLGEAGIGKTTTAREAAAHARRSGAIVRWSACWSGGGTVAHAPWLTLLSGLGGVGREAMDTLLGSDSGDTAGAGAARASAYAAVIAALEAATAERPALLVLDDLHWADAGTLHLLDVVAGQLPGLRVVVVGTYRPTDVAAGSALTRLGGGADRVELHGVDEAGVASLLGSHIGGGRAVALAPEVRRLTSGNPFLVVQLGRLLADDADALGRLGLPTGARDLLGQRLAALRDDDRALLVAAAVLGSPFRAVDLATVAGSTEVDGALGRAASARVVERAPGTGTWAFVHDLFRQAALDGVAPATVAELHSRAAAALEAADAEASVVAAHLLEAGADHRTDAARWSIRAGDRAIAVLAWEEAAAHYERALGALARTGDDQLRADALAGLGRARLLRGDDAGAARCFDELAAHGRNVGSAVVLARAALGWSADLSGFEVRLFDQGQIDLLDEAADALAAASPPMPGLRATVLARLSVALSLVAPPERRLALAEEAVTLARESGDLIVVARALAAHCDAIAGPDRSEDREAEASEIITIAENERDGVLELLGRRLRYVARLEQANVGGVEEDTTAFARRAQAIGNPLYLWYVPLWKAQLAAVAGDWEAALDGIAAVEALGAAAGSTNAPVLALVLRLTVLAANDEHQRAVDALSEMAIHAPGLAQHVSSLGAFALAFHRAGRPAEADAYLDRARTLGMTSAPFDAEWLPNATSLVAAAVARGHPILADLLPQLEPWAHRVSFEGIGAGLYGSVARFVAMGCSALGRHDDAVDYAESAVAVDRHFGGVVLADSLRTLAESIEARDGTTTRVVSLHASADDAAASRQVTSGPSPAPNELRRAGEVWHVSYGGDSVILRHSKGLADLAVLLTRPGADVHVSELEGVDRELVAGNGGEALDRRAIAAYKDRLAELSEELDDAEAAHDLARADLARVEYDALIDQLSSAVGLGGRTRSAGPEPIERLRKAVSARVRDTIRRIDAVHPPLGRHLANAVHTGTYCTYRPEAPTIWRCQA
jgi:tetratricopeptide (TPR) repeat protein